MSSRSKLLCSLLCACLIRPEARKSSVGLINDAQVSPQPESLVMAGYDSGLTLAVRLLRVVLGIDWVANRSKREFVGRTS